VDRLTTEGLREHRPISADSDLIPPSPHETGGNHRR
jgi:hypothetical protein